MINKNYEVPIEGSLGLLALGSVGLRAWREKRDGTPQPPRSTPPATPNPPRPRTLVIGWDAADWNVINPLLDSGKMPALEKLINNGVMGNIATLDPPYSPILWTSIATGKRGDKHGILGFVEPNPDGGGVRAINVTSRKSKALWNIFHNEGKKSNVVSWWPSHPAEPINGVVVSDLFRHGKTSMDKPWHLQEGSVSPPEMKNEIASLRIHPDELTEAHILPFVPRAGEIDQDKHKSLNHISNIISEAASIHAVATELIETTEWDFMAVYFNAIDSFCHNFMNYYPPKLDNVDPDHFELYKDVIEGAYIFHDMMLERTMNLAGPETTIILLSDHGFYSDHRRMEVLPETAAAPAMEHSPYGVVCMVGPNIKKDERIYGASLLDIAPTILHLSGLPVGKDMDGKILFNAFKNPVQPKIIDSWENVEGDFGEHPKHMKVDANAAAEALAQLVELGYIDDPGDNKNEAVERAKIEAEYNLSRVYRSGGKYIEALEIAEKLYEKKKDDIVYNFDLINYYFMFKKYDKAREIMNHLREIDTKSLTNTDLLEGKLMLYENKPQEALALLKKVENSKPRLTRLHIELGKTYIRLGSYKNAEKAFVKALEIDDGSAPAYNGIAICMLRTGRYEDAIENALHSIGLSYYLHPAHYHLGEALVMTKHYKEATEAFETCLVLAPHLHKARRWLVKLYSDKLNNSELAEKHAKILQHVMKGKVTIVSGLPRSGTSMAMQMLEAGGMDVLSDNNRTPDDNNPKGYYEYQAVKGSAKDISWVKDADDKVVKTIAQLLKHLPDDVDYKVVFMLRDMEEILRSQQIMLQRNPDDYPLVIAKAFEEELERVKVWADKRPNVEILYVNYKDIIANPAEKSEQINHFLSSSLNVNEMIKAVDEKLYRNKK